MEDHVERSARMARMLARLLNPEDLGMAVTSEVRDAAREALGQPRTETLPQPSAAGPDELPKSIITLGSGEPVTLPARNCNSCFYRPLEVYQSPCYECVSSQPPLQHWRSAA